MKYTIDRTKWLRGEGSMVSDLLREDGKMCCLGQIAKQCGLKPKELRNTASPMSLDQKPAEKFRKALPWLLKVDKVDAEFENTHICGVAMEVNDREKLSDAKREARLTAIFAKRGIELEFIN